MIGFSLLIRLTADEFWDSWKMVLSFERKLLSLALLGYNAIAPGVCREYIMVLLDDHLLLYLNVYPKKSSCALGSFSWNCLVFCGLSHNPLSFKKSLTTGVMYFPNMFLLLVIMMKTSAYLMQVVPRAILRYLPSLSLICIRCSLDLVKGYIDSLTAFSNPLRVKLASVGEIIPPCGVPFMESSYVPLSNILAFNHWLMIFFSSGCMNRFSSSQSWLILSKKPLISASSIHFSWFGIIRVPEGSVFPYLLPIELLIFSTLIVFSWFLAAAIAILQSL